MSHLFYTLSFVFLCSFIPISDRGNDKVVYICKGPRSQCYHRTPNCSGLNSCSTQIYKVTEYEAVNNYGRRACKKCY